MSLTAHFTHYFTIIILLCPWYNVHLCHYCIHWQKRRQAATQAHSSIIYQAEHFTVSWTHGFWHCCTRLSIHLSMTDGKFWLVIVCLLDAIDLTGLERSPLLIPKDIWILLNKGIWEWAGTQVLPGSIRLWNSTDAVLLVSTPVRPNLRYKRSYFSCCKLK